MLLFTLNIFASEQHTLRESRNVIERFMQDERIPLKLALKGNPDDNKEYKVEYKEGSLSIEANTGVAICRGFYDFVKSQKMGINSWSGNRFSWKKGVENTISLKKRAPFRHHYYLNVVTYGYSMPYWDWSRWSQEIDWMALHGIDMPLALVAQEAIMARVLKKVGLKDEEIAQYFVGPAHLPWMRMGNLSGIDGPMTSEWHAGQLDLQHKILGKMRALGMKPICPAFAGFVPPTIKRLYPDVALTKTSWAGSFYNWMLSPEDPLFLKLGSEFIKEWEKEFGKNKYYLLDSFNEMEIPFPPHGSPERARLLSSYGKNAYASIAAANPDAIWVMQGWMFGYQREIWDAKTLAALLKDVPDDKMLLLDLAVDYNKHFWHKSNNWDFYKGFFKKPWIYSVIPNMGGKTGQTGVLEFYANNHLEALASQNRGNLIGFGMAPEGIENNEVIYELLSDAGWSDKKIDLRDWLSSYSACRYGESIADFSNFWELMLQSVYGGFTDHPRFNWQLRPGTARNGTIQFNEAYAEAIKDFIEQGKVLGSSDLYQADLAEMLAFYLGIKLELLSRQIEDDLSLEKRKEAKKKMGDFLKIMLAMDRALVAHPTLRLDAWLEYSKKWQNICKDGKNYELNARRLISIWGPPINDYSARIWSGLIRDYYLERWRLYFENKLGAAHDLIAWEEDWVKKCTPLSPASAFSDLQAKAKEWILFADAALRSEDADTTARQSSRDKALLCLINLAEPQGLTLSISYKQLRRASYLELRRRAAASPYQIQEAFLLLDSHKLVLHFKDGKAMLNIPAAMKGNNECSVTLIMVNEPKASGIVELLLK